jgi:hypothetical protein
VTSFVAAAWRVVLEMSPWLLLGAGATVLLHRWLPRDFASRQLGGRWGVPKAVALGLPLPLCSCGVLPAGLGLRRQGASPGASVGFLISTPQTGVDSMLVSASFLGWPFAGAKLAAAAVTGLVGGWTTDAVAAPTAHPSETSEDGGRPGWRQSLAYGVDVLRMIIPWVLVGVVVSAVLELAIPPSAWGLLQAQSPLVLMTIALALSLPMYVCATGSVPIAAALVAHGFPVGAALVFLMAGPATNLGTLGALWKQLGPRPTLVYLAAIVGGSFGFGALASQLSIEAGGGHITHVPAPLAVACALVVAGFAIEWGWSKIRRLIARPSTASDTIRIEVSGMTCGGCARKVEAALRDAPSVTEATVDVSRGEAWVVGTQDVGALLERIRQAGFDGRVCAAGGSASQ